MIKSESQHDIAFGRIVRRARCPGLRPRRVGTNCTSTIVVVVNASNDSQVGVPVPLYRSTVVPFRVKHSRYQGFGETALPLSNRLNTVAMNVMRTSNARSTDRCISAVVLRSHIFRRLAYWMQTTHLAFYSRRYEDACGPVRVSPRARQPRFSTHTAVAARASRLYYRVRQAPNRTHNRKSHDVPAKERGECPQALIDVICSLRAPRWTGPGSRCGRARVRTDTPDPAQVQRIPSGRVRDKPCHPLGWTQSNGL